MTNADNVHAAFRILMRGWPKQGNVRRTYLSRVSEADKDVLEQAGLHVRKHGHNVVDIMPAPMPGAPHNWVWVAMRDDQIELQEKARLN